MQDNICSLKVELFLLLRPGSVTIVTSSRGLDRSAQSGWAISKLAQCQHFFKVFFRECGNLKISTLSTFFKVFFLWQFFLWVDRRALLSTFCWDITMSIFDMSNLQAKFKTVLEPGSEILHLQAESQKPCQRVNNADRKVFAIPESFCDKIIIGWRIPDTLQ